MNIVNSIKKVHRYVFWIVVLVIITGVLIIFINGYINTPIFLFSIKNEILNNKNIINIIGENRGNVIEFSERNLLEGDSAKFKITIIGECDSAYMAVKGTYYKSNKDYVYEIRDTLIVNKCR